MQYEEITEKTVLQKITPKMFRRECLILPCMLSQIRLKHREVKMVESELDQKEGQKCIDEIGRHQYSLQKDIAHLGIAPLELQRKA